MTKIDNNITEFKDTEIGRIPKEWKIKRLVEISKIFSGNTAPQKWEYFKNGKYAFIRVGNLTNTMICKYPLKYDLINDKAVQDLKLKKFKKGDIIFPKSGESIKLEKRAILKEDSYVVNHLAIIEPTNKINNLFLFYYMNTIKTADYLVGSSMPSLQLSVIKNFPVLLPPLEEQKRIADILSTVDEKINIINKEIQLTEKLKNGIIHKLLTEGIGHIEFKDTEIGRIPKEWKVVKLVEIIKYVKGKKPKELKLEYKDQYLPYLSTDYLRENKNTKFVDSLKNVILINEDDLILLWDGSNAGEVFLGRPGVLSSTMVRIQLKNNEYNKTFFYYLLKRNENYIKERTKGTGIPHVDKIVLNNINIPIPPLEEQKRIADILSTVDEKLELLNLKKQNLEILKKGLMNDLLTGKVRVKINDK